MKYESIIEAIKHYAGTQPDALAVCEMNKSVTYDSTGTASQKLPLPLWMLGCKRATMFCFGIFKISTI